jgi:hypothetical protein
MKIVVFVLLGLFSSGCTTLGRTKLMNPGHPLADSPGMINHVVLFDLQDSSDTDELVSDCYELLRLPWAKGGYAGQHYDIGRESVLQDYDVGLYVAFDSEEDYQRYLRLPGHVALVEKWKPRWVSIRVYDIGDARSIELKSQSDAEKLSD